MNIAEKVCENSKTFCAHAWTHSYIGSHYERQLCCVAEEFPNLRKSSHEDFWNSEEMRDARLKMIKGQKVDECALCYETERLGMKSARNNANIDQLLKMDDYDEFDINLNGYVNKAPSYFDYRTIYCNLQCVICGDVFSSKHIHLKKKMKYSHHEFNVDREFENSMSDQLINAIRNKEVNRIYWAGGEPMLSHIHWKVIEEMNILYEDPEYKKYIGTIHMFYNTNLTRLYWKNKFIPTLLKKFKPRIQASIDGTHEVFEFIRDGAKWDKIKYNWDQYYKHLYEGQGLTGLTITPVMTSLLLFNITKWIAYCEKNFNCEFSVHKYIAGDTSTNLLDIKFFPKHIFDRVIDNAIEEFKKTKINFRNDNIDILKAHRIEREENTEHY